MNAAQGFSILFTPNDDAWLRADAFTRRNFFDQLGQTALQVKRAELLAGLDKDGQPLAPIQPRSRPDHASGPPLCPHGAQSRTIRLLDFEPTDNGVRLYWRDNWGQILSYHAEGIISADGQTEPIRDVFGISPAGQERIRRTMLDWWRSR